MKVLFILLFTFLITGCDLSPTDSGPIDDGEGGGPAVGMHLKWGELSCQKSLKCKNPVLNLSYESVKTFLEFRFPQGDIVLNDEDDRHFSCGRVFLERWLKEFSQHHGLASRDLMKIANFGQQVLSIKKCTNHPDIIKKLNQYLNNIGEY